jgi:anti-sigma regulatory factor (Ser/Thr protein kinase)
MPAPVSTGEPRHAALLYQSPAEFQSSIAGFIGAGLSAGDAVFVASTRPQMSLLRPALDGSSDDVVWDDMADLGANPGRVISRLQFFADQHPGQAVRCVLEPAWPTRTQDELREAVRCEALINLALRGSPVTVLCPYDTRLGHRLMSSVERTHPVLRQGSQRWRSPSFTGTPPVPAECDLPLPRPPASADVLPYRDDMAVVRQFTASHARKAGLAPARVTDLAAAVHELAANTLAHTRGPGTLSVWDTGTEIICQISDGGHITDPLAGVLRPDPATTGGGRGLWVVHQMCDLVEIRTGPAGTTVRLHMRSGS